MTDISTELLIFIGRFHPLIVHFPIGIIVFAFLLQCLTAFSKHYKHAASLAWFFGACSAIVSCILGFCLSYSGGYDPDLLFWHQWLSIALAVVSTFAYALQCGCIKYQSKSFSFLLMIGSIVLLAITGHYGGSLTHGSNYLFEYAPKPLQDIVGYKPAISKAKTEVNNLSSLHIFNDVIAPVFANRCLSCHSTEKIEGGLDLSSQEGIEKGGAFGAVIQPGDADASELLNRITLPASDELAMPPEGKSRVSTERIRLIEWWINSGAPFDQTVDADNLPDDIQSILAAQFGLLSDESAPAITTPNASETDIQSLRERGFFVRQIAAEQPYVEVTIDPLKAQITNEDIQSLSSIQDQIVWLNLSGCGLHDDLLNALPAFANVSRLNLSSNPIGDTYISHLQSLSQLETLNLYQTNVTDESVAALKLLSNLKTLYTGETAITQNGIQQLQSANTELHIISSIQQ